MNEKQQQIKAFELWFNEEGKFLAPPTSDWEKLKEFALIVWLNACYASST